MSRPWTALIPLTALGLAFGAGLAPTYAAGPHVHELTPDFNGRTVPVQPGDEVVLKLPFQMPLWWAPSGAHPSLVMMTPEELRARGYKDTRNPTSEEIDDPRYRNALGRPKWFVVRYKVVAAPNDASAEWLYCKLGKLVEDGVPVRPQGPLKPGEVPTERGTFFRVKLTSAAAR
jgi:hypothetical protein